jgi:hypothetical protein
MNADYAFEVDPARDYIRLTMSGFFAPGDLPGFIAARQAAHARLTCAANAHVTLNDVRELKIQSQEMVDGFSRMLSVSAYHARRLAFVVGPGLTRTQVRRSIAGRDDVQCFESLRMAEAWLFSPGFAVPIQNLVGQEQLRTGS